MTHKDNAKHQQAYRERMKAAGFVQVIVWVPKSAVAKLRAYVKRLASSAGGGQ